jgi:hypothetical protein
VMEIPGGTKREMKTRMKFDKTYNVAPGDRCCQFFAFHS